MPLVTDELFTPTIKDAKVPTRPPWNPDSIIYPAFFGGPLAGSVLGFLNGRKLLLSRSHLLLIAGTGTVAFAARAALTATVLPSYARSIVAAIAGVVVWLVVAALQRKAFRAAIQNGRDAVSLVGPGIAAAIGFGVLEFAFIYGVLL